MVLGSSPAFARSEGGHASTAGMERSQASLPAAATRATSADKTGSTTQPRKSRRLIKKSKTPEPSAQPLTVPRLLVPNQDQPPITRSSKESQSRDRSQQSAPVISSGMTSLAPPVSMATVAQAVPMTSGAGSAIPSSSVASSSVTGIASGDGNGPKPAGRSMQYLIQQAPGLMQLVTGVPLPPAIPPEPLAPLPPPLSSPQAGLPAPPPNWFAYHVVNRLTYGGTPNQLNMVASLANATEARAWATAFMKEQLELDPTKPWPTNLHSTSPLPVPVVIQDIAADILLSQDKSTWKADASDAGILSPSFSELQDHDLIRKMHSRRQLKEKMVYFWENHFNTNYRTHGKGQYELQENEAFRARAFGNFLDLLLASGKSAAMMIYLNTDVNVKENPNENYAREVLELHTLGVTAQGTPNGYTQFDIVEAAKTFTGWDNTADVRGGFRFISSRHSPGSKLVLGQSIPFNGSSSSEGEQVLTLAARHPATARHVATKLCEYFVSDTPSAALVNETASVFSDSNGDIKKVLIAIFTSPDFMNVANYRGQVKTPLEYLVGLHRNLGVWSSREPFRTRLINVGQSIYEYAPPIGFKENALEWLNTNVLFHENSMAYEMTIPGFGNTIRYGSSSSGGQIRIWMEELKLSTEEQILGFLTNLTVDRMVTVTEYQLYLNTLRAGLNGRAFDIKNTSREDALDRTMATILTNPRYLYQ
jgi:uncharacterized protein (DUF1800 family)